MSPETAAVFDFDGTITKRDTLLPLALFFFRRLSVISFVVFLYYYGLFKFRLITNEALKEDFARCFFKGKDSREIQNLVLLFIRNHVKTRKDIYFSFRKHLKNGDKTIVLSANFDVVVQSWLKSVDADVDAVAATTLHQKEGIYTGKLETAVCRGENKAVRLKELIDISEYHIVSYADEISDAAVMSLADKQVWVGHGKNGFMGDGR